NGEIFNFMEIRQELQQQGHVFHTRSDTEVIVHAWQAWGERCVERFNGMFAFAIWDRDRDTLFLARDRLGVKPLFYTEFGDGLLAFASELKALMVHPDISREIDPRAVEEYFTFGYVADPRTIYSSVRKLEPGACITVRRGAGPLRPVRYWDVPLFGDRHAPGSEADWGAELRDRLRRAVELRL